MFGLKPIDHLNASLNQNTKSVYSHIFDFEKIFESQTQIQQINTWFKHNWTLSVIAALAYIFLIFTGKLYMHSRPKYDLRLPLVLWNLLLAAFSLAGTARMLPDFIYSLKNHGMVYTICNEECAYGITGFWSFAFVVSKLPELVDTLFIVLRKQELIFLHWYHHATVLVYCWYSYKDYNASGRWFVTMNYFVHSLMYTYYAFRAMRFRIPKWVSQLITCSQLVQMVLGCYVNYEAVRVMRDEPWVRCRNSMGSIASGSVMYATYFVLFFDFFVRAYVVKGGKKRGEAKME